MASLAPVGWMVIHSLWQGAFLAGITAVILALMPDRRARERHAIASISLSLMLIAPIVTVLATLDPFTRSTRFELTQVIDGAVTMPALVSWRAAVVPAAALLWMVGVAVCVLRVSAEWRRARVLRVVDLADPGDGVRSVVAGLRERLSLGAVDVRRSGRATVPMVLGWIRPLILLPAGTASELPPNQLRAILAHELAHVRRRDYLANLLQMGAETMLFHHPGARWVSRRIRTEREYCCDDVAVTIGTDAGDYARALAALDDARDDCRMAVAAASGTLLDRIQRVVGHPRPMLTPARAVAAFVVASFVASIILALSMVVPPDMPLDVKMRTRGPGPARQLPANPGSLPKTRS
jgi:bla regulator protein BlaR1